MTLAAVAMAVFALLAQLAYASPHEPKDLGSDEWDDLGVLYNYGSGKVAYWAFESSVTAPSTYRTFPRKLWGSISGWDGTKITPFLADVTGDAHADVISAYTYGATSTGLLVTPGTSGVSSSSRWWKSTGWASSKTKWTASKRFYATGAWNPVALYNYGNNTSGVWVFRPKAGNTFAPSKIWQSPAGGWSWARSKIAGGDFNNDGKGDLAILYDYTGNTTGLWLFVSNGSTYTKTRVWLSGAGAWNWSRSQLYAADLDDDGTDELFVPYTRSSNTTFFVFQPTGGGTSATLQNWGTSVYTFFDDIPMTLADVTHDHRADIVLWGTGDSDYGVSMEMLPNLGTSFEIELMYEVFNDSDPAHWNYMKTKLAR